MHGDGLGAALFSLVFPTSLTSAALLGSAPTEMFIAPVGTEIGSRQLEYLTKIRGTLDSDLVSVSSSFVCHLTKSASRCYRIVGEFDDPYDEAKPEQPNPKSRSKGGDPGGRERRRYRRRSQRTFLSEAPVFTSHKPRPMSTTP